MNEFVCVSAECNLSYEKTNTQAHAHTRTGLPVKIQPDWVAAGSASVVVPWGIYPYKCIQKVLKIITFVL